MEFVPLVALGLLVVKITSFLKFVIAGRKGDAVTQFVVWAAGVGVVTLFANSDFGGVLDVGGQPLDHYDFLAQVIIGLTVASTGAFAYDVKKAVDNTDTAAEPSLVRDGPVQVA